MPALHGQWAGPWNRAEAINPPPQPNEMDPCKLDPQWNEIAHLIVLPPPNGGLVLLLCRRHDYAGITGNCDFCPAQAFLWNPSDPSGLELTITLPQAIGGKDDPFCSAHALTSSGLAGIEGGSNHWADCDNGTGHDPPVGHSAVWIFDNVQFVRSQSAPQFYLNPTSMEQARWYGTAMQRGDDTTMVFGHFGWPLSQPPAQATRERGTWNGSAQPPQFTWKSMTQPDPDFVNYELSASFNECDLPASPFSVGDYPRIHQLANGLAVGVRESGYVLDFDWCPMALDNERFLPLATDIPQPQENSNTTVHYVDLRPDNGTGLFVNEWIVSIAGADKEAGCDPINPPAQTFAESAEGVFMKNPAPGAAWTSLPSLNKSRTEANAVVGLNGEIVVFGGYGHDAAGNVVARMKPELLRPIFEEGFLFRPALASAAWLGQCEMTDPHTYHSVACLLPDGRMLVGGGNYPCDDPPEQQGLDAGAQSFEIFSPPGLFGGPRPRIDSVSATELAYSTDPGVPLKFTIDVLLQGDDNDETGEFRVALTRPASVTHAFDNNQRYVVLQVDDAFSDFPGAPANSTISVFNPTAGQRNAVPPGYYLLTVVNEWGRPAAARWIRMVP